MTQVEQKQEVFGIERARQYARAHKKYAKLMFGGVLKRINTLGKTGRYLEIGAGPGFLAVMLAKANPDVSITVVDILPEMAEVGREYIEESGLQDRIEYIVGDVADEELIKGLGIFDVVYSTYSMHDWKEPEKSIRNLWKIIEESGVLYIHDFRKMGWLRYVPIKSGETEAMMAALSSRKIRAILRQTGFIDCRIRAFFPFIIQSVIARK